MHLLKRTTAAGSAVLAVLLPALVPAAPAAAGPAPAPCTWQVRPVEVPPFAERRFVTVDATDGEGNYSGRTLVGQSAYGVVLWSHETPRLLEGGGAAESVNRHGTIAGRVGAWDGPPAVWQGTGLVTKLPLPDAATSATADLIGDDGTVFGKGDGATGPVLWRCGS